MQSTRFLAASMLRQPATSSLLRARMAPMVRLQPATLTRQLRLQATPKMRMAAPKEEHAAHTVSQRLRQLRKVPPELIPLGIVLAIAVVFAGYSLINKLFSDKTLRLYRTGSGKASGGEH